MAKPPTNVVLNMQKAGLSDAEIIRRLREQGHTEKDINDAFNQAKVKETVGGDFPSKRNERGYPRYPNENTEYQESETANAMVPSDEEMAGGLEEEREDISNVPTPARGYEYGYGDQLTQEMPYEGGYGTEVSPQAEGYGYGYEEGYTAETFEEIAESIIEEKWQEFTERIGDIGNWKERTDRELDRIYNRIDKIDEAITSIHAALLEKVGEYGKSIKSLGSDVKAVEKALSQILEPLMKNIKELKEITEKVKSKKHRHD